MADQQLGTIDVNFTDSRKATSTHYSGSSADEGALINYGETQNILTLRTALSAFDAFTYTEEVLNGMTVNDIVFAWRACRGNEASISDYHPAQVARTA